MKLVESKAQALTKIQSLIKPNEGLLFLIIERDDLASRRQRWLNNFSEKTTSVVKRITLPDKTTVEMRQTL